MRFACRPDAIRAVESRLPETFKDDFAVCLRNVTEFARRQRQSIREFESEIDPGVRWGKS